MCGAGRRSGGARLPRRRAPVSTGGSVAAALPIYCRPTSRRFRIGVVRARFGRAAGFGPDERRDLGPRAHSELVQEPGHVLLHGLLAQVQGVGDRAVRAAPATSRWRWLNSRRVPWAWTMSARAASTGALAARKCAAERAAASAAASGRSCASSTRARAGTACPLDALKIEAIRETLGVERPVVVGVDPAEPDLGDAQVAVPAPALGRDRTLQIRRPEQQDPVAATLELDQRRSAHPVGQDAGARERRRCHEAARVQRPGQLADEHPDPARRRQRPGARQVGARVAGDVDADSMREVMSERARGVTRRTLRRGGRGGVAALRSA